MSWQLAIPVGPWLAQNACPQKKHESVQFRYASRRQVGMVVVVVVVGGGTGAQIIFGVVTGSARLPNWSVKSRVAPGFFAHLTL